MIKCLTLAAVLLSVTSLVAVAGPDGKADDFLFFDHFDEPEKPAALPPPPAVATAPSAVPLKSSSGRVFTILLERPEKDFARARCSELTGSATQKGNAPEPVLEWSGAYDSLQPSLANAAGILKAKINPLPDGVSLRVSCEGDYDYRERDCAGAAVAVLYAAMASGSPLAGDTAILGGVAKDGHITAVSELATRLRTLSAAGPVKVVGVPLLSEAEVRDIALMSEAEILVKLPVVALVGLEDAVALASATRPESMQKALVLFESVQKAAEATPVATLLKNPKFSSRLAEIIKLMPGHLSAKVLLQASAGKVPGRISYETSQQAILKAAKPFWDSVYANKTKEEIKTAATEAGNVLLRLQPKIDATVERYLVATKTYLRAINNYLAISSSPQHAAMRAAAGVNLGKLQQEVRLAKEQLEQKAKSK